MGIILRCRTFEEYENKQSIYNSLACRTGN